MRVEEEGRPVQRDGGLPGAGTALHDEHARQAGTDDLVLLRLDRLHDVAHPASPAGVHRGEQCGLTGEALVSVRIGDGEIQHLVIEARHGTLACLDLPSAAHSVA